MTESEPDLFDNEDSSAENESDLSSEAAGRAVLTGTDWTTETVLNQVRRQNIQLNPRFQRREAWTPERQSRFIESLMLGLPVPQLVLAERQDQHGRFIVIDGKQRLLSLRRFGALEDGDEFEQLKLRGLQIRADLNGKSLADMQKDDELTGDVAAFENQTIRTVVVRSWPNESYLYRVFLRLNTGSLPLSPQELRQALHPGPFLDFADLYSSESKPLQKVLGISQPDFRMRDVELMVRFFAFNLYLPQYRGNLKSFLDSTCSQLNDAWEQSESAIIERATRLDSAIDITFRIFGNDAFRRWSYDRYLGPFNRAVFDVMVYYFTIPEISQAALAVPSAVVDRFKKLCDSDIEFADAIQTTTKSIGAVVSRLAKWGAALSQATKITITVPRLVDGNILV
jgi:hypothetical protein